MKLATKKTTISKKKKSHSIGTFSTLTNVSSPSTQNFIGEFLILIGAFQKNSLVATLVTLGIILGLAYFLWLCNRMQQPKYIVVQ